MKKKVKILFLLFCFNPAFAQSDTFFKVEEDDVFHFYSQKMGTLLEILIPDSGDGDIVEKVDVVLLEVDRLTSIFSEYEEQSDVSRINKSAKNSEIIKVSPEVIEVILLSKKLFYSTNGAFDITFASFIEDGIPLALSFPDKMKIIKENNRIEEIVVNSIEKTVKITSPHVKIGLSGISKGYILRETGTLLEFFGEKNYLINAGGDIFAKGSRIGKKWIAGIKNPRKNNYLFMKVTVGDENSQSLATSGNYERFLLFEGQKYNHIIDTRTGFPAEKVISSSVIRHDPAIADGLATALMVLTEKERDELIDDFLIYTDDKAYYYDFVIIDKEGNVSMSPFLKNKKYELLGR